MLRVEKKLLGKGVAGNLFRVAPHLQKAGGGELLSDRGEPFGIVPGVQGIETLKKNPQGTFFEGVPDAE